MPVVGSGIPGLIPEFHDVRCWHLDLFPAVDVHLPVATVEQSIVEFELEGASVPDMIVTLGHGDGVLWPTPHDPVTLLFVSVPQHKAALLETGTDEDNFFVNSTVGESDIVGGSPVSAILSVPLAVNNEALRKRENERIGDTLGEASEKVKTGVSLPGEGPGKIWQSMFAETFATGAPMMLTVSGTVAVTVGLDAFVVERTEQVPGESHLVLGWAPVPVGINDGLFLVIPMSGVVLGLEVLELPEVAVDFDAWLPELDVLVDVGGVSAATFQFEGDQSVDIDLSIASLGGDPVRWVLAADQSFQDWAFGLEPLTDASNVTRPSAFGATDGVGGPDVSSIFASPVTGHVVWVLLARVLNMTTLHVSKTVVGHATPDPRAVIQGRTLTDGTVDVRHAINARRAARCGQEITVQRTTNVPRVTQCRRHDCRFGFRPRDKTPLVFPWSRSSGIPRQKSGSVRKPSRFYT